MKLILSAACALALVLGTASQAQAQRAFNVQGTFGAKVSAPPVRDYRGPPRGGSEHKAQSAGVGYSKICRQWHGRHPRCN